MLQNGESKGKTILLTGSKILKPLQTGMTTLIRKENKSSGYNLHPVVKLQFWCIEVRIVGWLCFMAYQPL